MGAQPGLPADQADVRQPRGGGLRLLPAGLRHRRRPGRLGGLQPPQRQGLAAGHPHGRGHGAQPHGHRLPLGHGAPRLVRGPGLQPLPLLQLRGRQPVVERRGRALPRGPLLLPQRRRGGLQAGRPRHRGGALHLPRQRRHQHALERHRPAGLPQSRGSRSGHPDHPARGPQLPGHPLRRGDDPDQEALPAPVVSGAGDRGRHPLEGRPRPDPQRLRPGNARRVLEGGGRPGRAGGSGHPAAGRGLLAARGLLRPHPWHAPGVQQRLHEHAQERAQRRVPQRDQEHPRVQPRDPQALRQLHEQPGRGNRRRPVRQGGQVLRGVHPDDHPPGTADVRPRPDRGLYGEVRHGVPPGLLGRVARRGVGAPARAADLPAGAPPGPVRRGRELPALRPDDPRGGGQRRRVRLLQPDGQRRRRGRGRPGGVPQPLRRHPRLGARLDRRIGTQRPGGGAYAPAALPRRRAGPARGPAGVLPVPGCGERARVPPSLPGAPQSGVVRGARGLPAARVPGFQHRRGQPGRAVRHPGGLPRRARGAEHGRSPARSGAAAPPRPGQSAAQPPAFRAPACPRPDRRPASRGNRTTDPRAPRGTPGPPRGGRASRAGDPGAAGDGTPRRGPRSTLRRGGHPRKRPGGRRGNPRRPGLAHPPEPGGLSGAWAGGSPGGACAPRATPGPGARPGARAPRLGSHLWPGGPAGLGVRP